MRVLVADVGGTNCRFAIAEDGGLPGHALGSPHTYPSGSASGIEPLLRDFLALTGARPDVLSLAVAGPVEDGVCRATNLPWELDVRRIEAEVRAVGVAARIALFNDLEAVAWGVRDVPHELRVTLQEGAPDLDGPLAVIGAGTGLGEALAVPCGASLRVLASEGGHADLAPRDAFEDGLLAFLRERFPGHVSYERVLSGPGLGALYEHVAPLGVERDEVLGAADPGREVVSRVATSAAARRTAEAFVDLLGAEAGNLALKSLPTGGLFVAGGVAPRLRGVVQDRFLRAFLAKGRMRRVLERVPVHLVLDGQVGLRGAAARAFATRGGALE